MAEQQQISPTPTGQGFRVFDAVWRGPVADDGTDRLAPMGWKGGLRVLIDPDTNLFGPEAPDRAIDDAIVVMALRPDLTFVLPTRHTARIRAYVDKLVDEPHGDTLKRVVAAWPVVNGVKAATRTIDIPLPNLWLGACVSNQSDADDRIPDLLATTAAKRFAYASPLLAPLDLTRVGNMASIRRAFPGVVEREEHGRPKTGDGSIRGTQIDAIGRAGSSIKFFQTPDHMGGFEVTSPRLWPRLDWVLAAGALGPDALPTHPDWIRSLRDQCAAEDTDVPFAFEGWGTWAPHKPTAGCNLGADVRDGRVCTVHPSGRSDVEVFVATGGRSSEPGSRYMKRVGYQAAGRLLDGVAHNGIPGHG